MRLIYLLMLLSLFSISIATADIGPKPHAYITVTLDGNAVPDTEFSAEMLECRNWVERRSMNNSTPALYTIEEFDNSKNCTWRPSGLAWGGDCKKSKCSFTYVLPQEFKLAIYIPSKDKIFISNEIARTEFNSHYAANLSSDGTAHIATITPEKTPRTPREQLYSFIKALIITLIIEFGVALIYFSKAKKKTLISVLLASMITLPLLWYGLPPLLQTISPSIVVIIQAVLLAEAAIIILEGGIIHMLNKQTITLKQSLSLSLFMNLASFILGGILYLLIPFP